MREECGVVAIALKNKKNVPELLYRMLLRLQHRGQESAGIVTFNNSAKVKLKKYVEVGSVNEVFRVRDENANEAILNYYAGTKGIGHVRYSTSGKARKYEELKEEAQPFYRQHGKRWKRFALAFNGNLANFEELKKELKEEHEYDLDTEVDTEVIMHYLSIDMKSLEKKIGKPDLTEVFSQTSKKLDGAYNIVFLNGEGDMIILRDPLGIRPLWYGENSELFAAASESVALKSVGIEEKNMKEVEPGTIILLEEGKEIKIYRYAEEKKASCVFEPVYFMWDSSLFSSRGERVNIVRRRLGEELAKTEPLREKIETNREEYVVVPVPSTSIPAAETLAEHLEILKVEALRKRGEERGFIEKEKMRHLVINGKYDVICELIKGKKVIVVEDSIVRGDTSKKIAALLREEGAAEIHLRSTFPPIRFPCFYGIDFPTLEELIAASYKNTEEAEREIAKINNFDSLHYQTLEGLLNALKISKNEACIACLTGNYPTQYGQKKLARFLKSMKA